MAVYLSPGVFPIEIDLSQIPTGVGPLLPAFIGTANKGPMNQATYITNSQQFIDTFGTPFPESYLGYAVLAYMEEGQACYIMRVGIEYALGQPPALSQIAIDTSGARVQGWGRIPVFTGIDYGHIDLRPITTTDPVSIHVASISGVEYNDVLVSNTWGPTAATLNLQSGGSGYTGAIADSYVMIITGAPTTSGSPIEGATYQIVRNSDGELVAEGVLDDPNWVAGPTGLSSWIDCGRGIVVQVHVTSGHLDTNDTFLFDVAPNNQTFVISVEGLPAVPVTLTTHTYTDVPSFVAAMNAAAAAAYSDANVDLQYSFVTKVLSDEVTLIPQIRTNIAGHWLQIISGTYGEPPVYSSSDAFAQHLGTQQYAWDIPRSHLLALDSGPFSITSSNNRVVINAIGTHTQQLVFNLPVGLNQSPHSIATSINNAGVYNGQTYFESFALTIPAGTHHVVIITPLSGGPVDHKLDTLQLMSSYSNLKTLRFAEELLIPYPYHQPYRGYTDDRVTLPLSGQYDAAIPLVCEADPFSAQCLQDTAYFENIVGWFVAPSPGTWLTGHTVNLELATDVVGNPAGRYNIIVRDPSGLTVEIDQDVNFDQTSARYVGNVINPGTPIGGQNGSAYLNWEPRPSFLNNDPTNIDYVVRLPSPLNNLTYMGMANGIPLDPAYSSDLDAAVIGNPAESGGIYQFQNPEVYDINLLVLPGFSSGAIIGQGLQMCEARGDVLFIVDPPFGLRPQQVVDWHNGMLLSDLRSAINSSYGALYWGWLQTFDQFSANNIWVPPSGHVAAIFSRTSRVAEQWFAPAGLRRGHILTALDVEYSPSQGERDLLYGSGNAVNPIVNFPKDGLTIWGQRTLQRAQTALDRVNVRMLLIFIKKNLTSLLRQFVFEPNDTVLWKQVLAVVNPFLADIQARRGLTGFNVICDATNNTPERQDRNELWVSVFLKPTRAVEFIILNLVIMRTGASFSASEILAAGGIVTTQ